jgi:hypothetical protein
MPYANSASVLVIGGLSQQPMVTARLLDVYTAVGGPGGPEQHEDEIDSTTFQSSTSQVPFTMVWGPGGTLPNRDVALTMDIATGPQDGPIFRSGVFPTLPATPPTDPNGFIDIVLDDMRTVTQPTIDAALPASPFTVTRPDGSSVTMTTLTAMVGSGTLDISAVGTATHPSLPAPQPFSYTVSLSMAPETSVRDLSSSLIVWAPAAGSLAFTSAGGVAAAVQTAILNLLSGWIEGDLRAAVVGAVNTAVNAAAITATAGALGVPAPPGSPPALPSGVILSFRRVVVGTIGGVTGIHVWAALGSFGSLRAKFPPPPAGGGRTCLVGALALSVPVVDLALFRQVRDEALCRNALGRRIVRWYYRGSPRMANWLGDHPTLARALGRLAVAAQRPLAWCLRRT